MTSSVLVFLLPVLLLGVVGVVASIRGVLVDGYGRRPDRSVDGGLRRR